MRNEKFPAGKVPDRHFKFLGFALGRDRNDTTYHAKSMKKAKEKLREPTSRSQGRNVRLAMNNVRVYMRGWLGYYGIARMKSTMEIWNARLRRRIRMYIWKQWKKPMTRVRSLVKLGMEEWKFGTPGCAAESECTFGNRGRSRGRV